MLVYLAAFVVSLASALFATRMVRSWATRAGLLDVPDGNRKAHDRAVPRVGGIGIFISLAIAVGVGLLFLPPTILTGARLSPFVAVLLGGCAMFAIGLVDDIVGLTPVMKFVPQTAVALGLVLAGLSISNVALPGGGQYVLPTWLGSAITMVWIVGITNAFNLIDGADGVAAGAAVIAAGSLAVVSFMSGNYLGGLAAMALAGAALGFLFFNFPPATIFLGDCGSLLLGFILAAIGLVTAQTAPTMLAVAIPVVSFGLPILDTMLAMTRRFLRGDTVFNPDRGHIHHRLRDLGHSPRTVTLLLYSACAAFALISLLLVHPDGRFAGTLFAVGGIVLWIAVQRLHIPELLELRRIVGRGLRQRTAIAQNVRVREAILRLHNATTPEAVTDAISYGLSSSDFIRAELWVDEPLAHPLLNGGIADADGDAGALWRWAREEDALPELSWEFRLSFNDGNGQTVGRLSLWHSSRVEHVLTDMCLIAADFMPQLHRALLRVQKHAGIEPVTSPKTADRPLRLVVE